MEPITPKKNHKQLIFMLLLIVVIVPVFVLYFGVIKPRQQNASTAENIKIDGIVLPLAKEINDFHLTDNHGNPFTKANLKDHWTFMFFGFTNCGMICPTTLSALNQMYKTLQKELPDTKLPQVVLVSVDPERDSVERLNEYVNSFNTHFMGARAEMPETLALEKQLAIAAAKMQAGKAKNQYTINHSAEILVFNPSGKLQAYLSYPHEAEQLVKDYKLILTMS